jgi:hypothetical protein
MEIVTTSKRMLRTPASGRVTNANGASAGSLHACFGATADSLVVNFFAEGEVGGMSLVGRGQCRTTKRDFPETGFTLFACQLDLTGLPPEYVGGQLTTNTLQSRTTLGADTEPPATHTAVDRHDRPGEEAISGRRTSALRWRHYLASLWCGRMITMAGRSRARS